MEWCEMPGGLLVTFRGGAFNDHVDILPFGKLNLDWSMNTYDATKRDTPVLNAGFRVVFIPRL
jgi:hypothetical protein